MAIALAAGVLVLWGLSWWTALLVALLLVCPALILWGLYATRPSATPEPEPKTCGMIMNWAAPFYDLLKRSDIMHTKFLRYSIAGVLALLLALAPLTASASENTQYQIVDGVSIYVGVLPAEMLLGHPKEHHEREMHGGVPAGTNRYHIVVALFDAASGKRITYAQVKIGGASIGMAAARNKAEPMLVNSQVTYGNYVTLPGQGPYKIQIEIRRTGTSKVIEVEFDYPFART